MVASNIKKLNDKQLQTLETRLYVTWYRHSTRVSCNLLSDTKDGISEDGWSSVITVPLAAYQDKQLYQCSSEYRQCVEELKERKVEPLARPYWSVAVNVTQTLLGSPATDDLSFDQLFGEEPEVDEAFKEIVDDWEGVDGSVDSVLGQLRGNFNTVREALANFNIADHIGNGINIDELNEKLKLTDQMKAVEQLKDSLNVAEKLQEGLNVAEQLKQSLNVNDKLQESLHLVEQLKDNFDVNKKLQEGFDMADQMRQSLNVTDNLEESVNVAEQLEKRLNVAEQVKSNLNLAGQLNMAGHLKGKLDVGNCVLGKWGFAK